MPSYNTKFDFLRYLAEMSGENGNIDSDRIPPLADLSEQHGVSIATLREQLHAARVMGFVEVRPRTGIRRIPYKFGPAVSESLSYAIAIDKSHFDSFADLRKKIEADYWFEAVEKLSQEDIEELNVLLDQATNKLDGHPIHIPHTEHRKLHMTIFKHIKNPFVIGIFEAYWNAYEEVGLNRYEHLEYLQDVWSYHQKIVAAISSGKMQLSHKILIKHFDLLSSRSA